MSSIPVNLAIEDELSEAVLRRLLADARRGYSIGTAYGRNGFGYLRKTIVGWNQAAKGIPFVVLTDLDAEACPPALIQDWLHVPKHPNLLLLVAVREVETWLLSDHTHLARYLHCPVASMPGAPEELPDPKETLVNLARTSRSAEIRARLVPRSGSTARQGPQYNGCMSEFVRASWNWADAAARSRSLDRAVKRLHSFVPSWAGGPR